MSGICYACDGEAVLVREPAEVRVGQRTVTVTGEFMRCRVCAEEFFLPGQMDALQREASEQIRRENGLLLPGEIRAIREAFGLSQADFEKLIGAGPKTVVRWERGTVAQNATADTLLRVLRDFPEVAHRLAAERAKCEWGSRPPESPIGRSES